MDIQTKLHLIIYSGNEDFLNQLLSYNVDFNEAYKLIFNEINLCECSYELQCAIFDTDEDLYNLSVDYYFFDKYREKRIDKNFILLDNRI